jgi:hypothetical protein
MPRRVCVSIVAFFPDRLPVCGGERRVFVGVAKVAGRRLVLKQDDVIFSEFVRLAQV